MAIYIDYLLLEAQSNNSGDKTAGVSILAFTGMAWWMNMPAKQYAKHFKKAVLPIVLKAFDPTFYYDPDAHLSMGLFDKSGLFHKGLALKQEDHIFGTYKGVGFSFLEAQFRTRGKNSRTVFQGGIIILDFKQDFTAHTMLKKDAGSLGNFFGGGKSKIEKEKFQRVKLEDPDFERMFEVYSTDQQEARYILSPSLMQRLKTIKLGRSSEKVPVQAAFFKNHAIFYISYTDDLLEPPHVSEQIVSLDPIIEILFELDKICGVVDDLNLIFFAKRREGAARMDEIAEALDTAAVPPPPRKSYRRKTPAARPPTSTSPFNKS